jgi:hypothetical protein
MRNKETIIRTSVIFRETRYIVYAIFLAAPLETAYENVNKTAQVVSGGPKANGLTVSLTQERWRIDWFVLNSFDGGAPPCTSFQNQYALSLIPLLEAFGQCQGA